jgi:hypothetical protein
VATFVVVVLLISRLFPHGGWEQGEDLSLVEFTSFEYQQSKQAVAGEDIKQDILKTGIRELERKTGVSHHTLEKILRGESVRRKTLAKMLNKFACKRQTPVRTKLAQAAEKLERG